MYKQSVDNNITKYKRSVDNNLIKNCKKNTDFLDLK